MVSTLKGDARRMTVAAPSPASETFLTCNQLCADRVPQPRQRIQKNVVTPSLRRASDLCVASVVRRLVKCIVMDEEERFSRSFAGSG